MASAEEALEVAAAQPAAAALQRLGHIQEEDLPQEERQGQKKPCLNDRIMVLKCDWLEMVSSREEDNGNSEPQVSPWFCVASGQREHIR